MTTSFPRPLQPETMDQVTRRLSYLSQPERPR